MKEKLKPYSFPISDELKESLQQLADADRRLLASYIRATLEKHVEAARKKSPALFEPHEETATA
jgi:predicted DNA-binding protein